MSLRPRNKRQAQYNMSSLTDVIFLLLIFFMLTSTMVAPNAIKLLLPRASGQTMSKQTTTVSVTKEGEYYVDEKKVPLSRLSQAISKKTAGVDNPTVVLRVDKNAEVNKMVKVMSIGNKLEVRMIMATKPVEK